jgi:ABC-type antimicrobial peptide transport system permease subunit
MDQNSFFIGFAVGFVTAGVIIFLFNQIRHSWRQVGTPPTVLKGGKPVPPSPLQAVTASLKALFYMAVWAFLLFAMLALIYGILSGELLSG